jgi:ferredoxin
MFWQAQSDKGKELTESLKDFFADADSADEQKLTEAKNKTTKVLEQLPLKKLTLPEFAGKAQEKMFNAGFWAKVHETCLGCGTCTYSCPTCHCYDVRDFDTGYKIERFRCWDSCMSSDFTNMAHGNSRKSHLERFRQRFMHKLIYFPRNNEGSYACVGCGRCLSMCPVSLDIAKVMQKMAGDNNV